MFLIDRMMVSGLHWILATVQKAAQAEMNDDTGLRQALMDASVRFEAGEIDEDEFAQVEEIILARLREIREMRTGGEAAGPIAWTSADDDEADETVVDAALSGDFHEAPAEEPPRHARAAPRRRAHR